MPPELLILAQICTKSFVGWGFAPDPTYSAPPDHLAGSGGRAPGKGNEGGEGERREEKEERISEGKGGSPECQNPELAIRIRM